MGSVVTVDTRALTGALVALSRLEPDIRKDAAAATRRTLTPMFRQTVARNTRSRQDERVLGTGASVRATGSGSGKLVAYTSSRALAGGLVPSTQWPYVEFGSLGEHARRGQLPRRVSSGRMFYPAVKAFGPTAARVWLAVIYDAVHRTGLTEAG